MVNEDLVNFLFDKIKKHVTNVKVLDEVASTELYVPFRSRQIDTLPFIVDVDGYSFQNVHLIFKVASWDKKVIKAIMFVDFPVEKIYPITLGIGGGLGLGGHQFGPMLPPMEGIRLTNEWLAVRYDQNGTADMFSMFLNKSFDTKKMLEKDLKPGYTVQEGKWLTTFYDKTNIILAPTEDKENMVRITFSIFRDFKPKKDNFFPKLDLTKVFKYLDKIIGLYKEFITKFDFSKYPLDPFLNGPESFICKRCESMIFPKKIHLWKNYGKQFLTLESFCYNCNLRRKILSHQQDQRILEAASEFFWVCPFDLTPYQILKEGERRNTIIFDMVCPTCRKKIKKEIQKDFVDIVESGREKPSPKLTLDGGFVDYKFWE